MNEIGPRPHGHPAARRSLFDACFIGTAACSFDIRWVISEIVYQLLVAAARVWWELLASPLVWAGMALAATILYVEYG